jgi:hypothetical protein
MLNPQLANRLSINPLTIRKELLKLVSLIKNEQRQFRSTGSAKTRFLITHRKSSTGCHVTTDHFMTRPMPSQVRVRATVVSSGDNAIDAIVVNLS